MIKYVIAALISLSVLIAFVGVIQLLRQRRRVPERLQQLREQSELPQAPSTVIADRPLPFLGKVAAFVGWTLPHMAVSEPLRWELARAGWRHLEARRVYAGSKVLGAIVLGGAMALIGTRLTLRQDELLLLIATMSLLGFFVPSMVLALTQRHRGQEILLALPDALDLMVICVEAGQGLNAALISVGQEIRLRSQCLSDELRLVNHEMRAGLSRAQALRNLANRTGVDETRSLVAVLVQSDRLGTSITQALRAHAQSLRTRRRQRAEEAARKTAVKLVFPLVFCIFPALLVVILASGMIQVFEALTQSGGG